MDFSAAHTLWRPDWDDARNRAVYGSAASSLGHGHNYELEVTIRGDVDPDTGMVIDLKELKEIMSAEIEARFDHRNLNEDTECFRSTPPTAENLATVIFELLDRALPGELLYGVRLRPTPDLCVEVTR
jgi:6-pyruvoyltetrahydropterin/6-carboxytetrahydropterin synthase